MTSPAAAYGERHASVYDRIYGARFAPEAAVEVLAGAGAVGGVLELGLGTGRLALPLVRRGVDVDGIEGSPAMIARLRAQPDGERVGVFEADLASFDLLRHDYGAAVCAVSTLFMLTHADQATCLASAARHLRPGGLLLVEAFRFDPDRFDAEGRREEPRTGGHVVRSRHDVEGRAVEIRHLLDGEEYAVRLAYRDPDELDALAEAVGLEPVARWHDWTRRPAGPDSRDPISVYRRTGASAALPDPQKEDGRPQ